MCGLLRYIFIRSKSTVMKNIFSGIKHGFLRIKGLNVFFSKYKYGLLKNNLFMDPKIDFCAIILQGPKLDF